MNSLLDDTDDEHEHLHHHGGDREITLGTTMILLIFFALAVYGAALFGFGYSMGSKHTGGTTGTVATGSNANSTFNAFKPAPGSPVGSVAGGKTPVADTTPVPYMAPPPVTKTVPLPAASKDDPSLDEFAAKPASKPASSAAVAAASAAPMPPLGAGVVVVQVAAVSHQEDADMIASTLRRRGYAVTVRPETDKLVHVQVGPFATKKDAEAMRARLLADGFNAYIK